MYLFSTMCLNMEYILNLEHFDRTQSILSATERKSKYNTQAFMGNTASENKKKTQQTYK